jgi:hypothetical protein
MPAEQWGWKAFHEYFRYFMYIIYINFLLVFILS